MTTVAHVQLASAPCPGRLEQLLADGHRGISLYLPDSDAAESVLGWAEDEWSPLEDAEALVSVNLSRGAIPAVAMLAARHQACTFAISHLGDPGSFRAPPSRAFAAERMAPLLGLAEHPNTYVKISGLYAVSDPPHDYPHRQARPFIEQVLEAFGAWRCMWGSDFSPALDHVSFVQTTDTPWLSGLAEEERAQVMGGTLMELLGRPGN
jgi:L-fuconolactonase